MNLSRKLKTAGNMRKMLTAMATLVAARRRQHYRRRALALVAALLCVVVPQAASADISIGPGGGSSNPPAQTGGSNQIGGGSSLPNTPPTTYSTNLGSLIGWDLVLNGASSATADQLLADVVRGMQDTSATGQTTPRPTPQINSLLAFTAAQLECKQGTFSCSSNMFVPGDFAGGVYAMVVTGCARSTDPTICVTRLGQIDVSCTAAVALFCSTPGVPVVTGLFTSVASVLEVQSYSNGALRVFVPTPVAPGGGTGSPGPVAPGGAIFFPEVTSAVPEPATWAMMIVGFGMIGGATRRRRRTTVAYA